MQKYFVSKEDLESKTITGDDVFHIKNVMRFTVGDEILVSDQSVVYKVRISAIGAKVSYEIVEEINGNNELPFFISIFQGYPKGDKIEDVIKHGTELGASEFYPTIMKRSIFKLDEKKKESKLVRFNKIAKEAAEQSNRNIIPKVVDIKRLDKIDFSNYNVKILCYEEDSKNNECLKFKGIIKNLKKDDRVAIIIGPEGGIDNSEVELLTSKGFISCALGPRILRTESVVFYALSSISYEWELKW